MKLCRTQAFWDAKSLRKQLTFWRDHLIIEGSAWILSEYPNGQYYPYEVELVDVRGNFGWLRTDVGYVVRRDACYPTKQAAQECIADYYGRKASWYLKWQSQILKEISHAETKS